MVSGIYSIYCKVNNKYYIGQSVDVYERMHHHRSRLKKGEHKVKDLQEDYNTYGEDKFVFKVEKLIEEQFLSSLETHFMEFYDSINKGYNTNNTRVIVRKEDKELKLAEGQLNHFSDLDELYIDINAEDIKVVMLLYYTKNIVDCMNTDELRSDEDGVLSGSLSELINKYTINDVVIDRYALQFKDYIQRYIESKFNYLQVDGCEILLPSTKERDYRSSYIGDINNILMGAKLKVGVMYRGKKSDVGYYKELSIILKDSKEPILWNVKNNKKKY